MRSNRFIIKIFAVLLLVLFSQKVGAGIYLHNWLHAKSCKKASQNNSNTVSYNCNCIDDFSMPFAEPVIETVSFVTVPHPDFVSSYIASMPDVFHVFHSLRAPPPYIA